MSFFSKPQEFSFKDLLAVTFSGFFLFYCYVALSNGQALDLVRALIPLIGIILGGYFGQEAIQMWQQQKTGNKEQEGDGDCEHPRV